MTPNLQQSGGVESNTNIELCEWASYMYTLVIVLPSVTFKNALRFFLYSECNATSHGIQKLQEMTDLITIQNCHHHITPTPWVELGILPTQIPPCINLLQLQKLVNTCKAL